MHRENLLSGDAGTVKIGIEKPELAAPSGYFAVTETMGRVSVKKSWNRYETLPWAMVVAKRNRASVRSACVDDLPQNTKFYAWDGEALHEIEESTARELAKQNEQARADQRDLSKYRGDKYLYGLGA